MIPEIGSYIRILAYKHDGHVRRSWNEGYVLEADEHSCILVTNKALVKDDDGHYWYTREPALCYFYDDKWFNVIAMFREKGIYYYCNLASPYLYDGEALKYIDYDLDYKFLPNGSVNLLDEDEFAEHKVAMNYPAEIEGILRDNRVIMLDLFRSMKPPFNTQYNEEKFDEYLACLSQ